MTPVQLEQLPEDITYQLSVILQHRHARRATNKTVTLSFTPWGDYPLVHRTTCRPETLVNDHTCPNDLHNQNGPDDPNASDNLNKTYKI